MGIQQLVEVRVPESWKDAEDEKLAVKDEPEFIKKFRR